MRLQIYAFVLGLTISAFAFAQEKEAFSIGAGYSQISIGGEYGADLDGWGMTFHWRFWPVEERDGPVLRLGLQTLRTTGNGGGLSEDLLKTENIWDITMLTPQIEVGWHQKIGSDLFVEPSIGAGWAIVAFQPRDIFADAETATGFVLRPGVLLGFGGSAWSIGFEATYGLERIDFEEGVGGTNVETYLGLFMRALF
jgi:hypothetical protein